FSSAVTSLSAAVAGSTARRSRLRPIHRISVDRPIPRSPAISRCVRPLASAKRTASSSNSFLNRRCCIVEFLIRSQELSTFPEQVQPPSGWVEDFHLRAIEHARHTTKPLRDKRSERRLRKLLSERIAVSKPNRQTG